MAGSNGMAGLAVTALVSALVAFGVASLLPVGPGPPAAPAAGDSADGLRRDVDRLRRELEEVRAARGGPGTAPGAVPPGAPGTPVAAAPPSPGAPGAGPGPAEDGPLPASRGELVALIDERIAGKAAEAIAGVAGSARARRKVTIEEASGELGLSSVDADAVKRIWRESEEELVATVMGTADLDLVKEELRAARDDPDRKAALINRAVGNVIRNLGRVATLEDRRRRDLKRFLTDEQIRKLKEYDIKSTLDDPELEEVLKDAFGN